MNVPKYQANVSWFFNYYYLYQPLKFNSRVSTSTGDSMLPQDKGTSVTS